MNSTVTILRNGNVLTVDSLNPLVVSRIQEALRFTEVKVLYGLERVKAGESVRTIRHLCYAKDARGRLVTQLGYYRRIEEALAGVGIATVFREVGVVKPPGVYDIDWNALLDNPNIKFRAGQREALVAMAANPCGRFHCATGFGKSFMIALVAMAFRNARIHIVTRRVTVARNLCRELAMTVPDVGLVGDGSKKMDSRVVVFTASSLHLSKKNADLLLGDEDHELSADRASAYLAGYLGSRNFGFSASPNLRPDNKDMRSEGTFGPIIYHVPYQEALANGLVSPIHIRWNPVPMRGNPGDGLESIAKKRACLWRNMTRNKIIADDAESYPADVQRLIYVETIEHAVRLKSLLPDYELVHAVNGMSREDRNYYVANGWLSPEEPAMTQDRKDRLTTMFENGKLLKAICNTVWSVGVSFNNLAVLLRGDAADSRIGDIQIPGRVSRLGDDKDHGVIHDYWDQFDPSLAKRARSRFKAYAENAWEQYDAKTGLRLVKSPFKATPKL